MLPINYRHLIAFIAVARHGSFTQAAAHLHLTQSTLTATIKQLEAETAIQLLDRTTRQVNLTRDGERFFPVAERLVSDFDAALSDLIASSQQQQGSVSLAASASVVNTLLPSVIAEYHQAFPKVAMTVMEEGASGIEACVADNRADFGIGSNHSQQPNLDYSPVLLDRYGVVLPPDHPFLVNPPDSLQWEDVLGLPQILLTIDNGIRVQLDTFIQNSPYSYQAANNSVEATTPSTLATLIRSKMGVSILPALAASTPAFADLVFVPIAEPLLDRELCIITRKGRSLSPAGQEMVLRVKTMFLSMSLPSHVRKTAT